MRCLALAIALMLLAGCGNPASGETQTGTGIVMGTVFSVSLTAEKQRSGEGAQTSSAELPAQLLSLGAELERNFLSRRVPESELARINASAGDPEGYPLSPEMEALLADCLRLSEETGGAFDITIGALVQLWDIDGWAAGDRSGGAAPGELAADDFSERQGGGAESAFRPPSGEEIAEALAHCGYERVRIADHRIYLPEGMSLDLGAAGKGIFLGKARALLDGMGDPGGRGYASDRESGGGSAASPRIYGTVSAGGSVLTYGEKAGGEPWSIGIADPFGDSGLYGTVPVSGTMCLSTSGDYERYVESDGIRYHHILDPRTGYPAGYPERAPLASVTVLGADGFWTDALSTAIFVLGEEEGLALAEAYGVEVILIRRDGSMAETLYNNSGGRPD